MYKNKCDCLEGNFWPELDVNEDIFQKYCSFHKRGGLRGEREWGGGGVTSKKYLLAALMGREIYIHIYSDKIL